MITCMNELSAVSYEPSAVPSALNREGAEIESFARTSRPSAFAVKRSHSANTYYTLVECFVLVE